MVIGIAAGWSWGRTWWLQVRPVINERWLIRGSVSLLWVLHRAPRVIQLQKSEASQRRCGCFVAHIPAKICCLYYNCACRLLSVLFRFSRFVSKPSDHPLWVAVDWIMMPCWAAREGLPNVHKAARTEHTPSKLAVEERSVRGGHPKRNTAILWNRETNRYLSPARLLNAASKSGSLRCFVFDLTLFRY